VVRQRRAGRPARGRVVPLTAAVLIAVFGAVACTSSATDDAPLTAEAPPLEEPVAAPAGRDVEIVLPARATLAPPVAAGLEERLGALTGTLPEGVDSLSVRVPDEAVFVPDLLELAAAEGTGLVCAIGPEVVPEADRTAIRHAGTRVCAMPGEGPTSGEEATDEPTPAVRVDVPVEELGELVGTAAATAARVAADAAAAADDDATDGADGEEAEGSEPEDPPAVTPRIGLLLTGDELPSARFRTGLLRGLGAVESVEPASDLPPLEALEEVLSAGVQVVVVDGGAGAGPIVAELDGRAGIVGPADLWGDDLPAGVVLAYRLRWDAVLSAVLERFAGEGEFPASVPLGIADGALELRPGPEQAATQAAVDAVRTELAERDEPPVSTRDEGPPDALR